MQKTTGTTSFDARCDMLTLHCAYELEGIGELVLDNYVPGSDDAFAMRGLMLRVQQLARVLMGLEDSPDAERLAELEDAVHGPHWQPLKREASHG